MPVHVEKRGDQWCVIEENGESKKCYDTKEAADSYRDALNIAYAKAKGHIPMDEEVREQLRLIDDDLRPYNE